MERPAKRQKLDESFIPTRTLDLNVLQRTISPRRPSKIILPRKPDVTITAGLLEVAINEGTVATQITLPTSQVAVPISGLGTLTLPGLTSASLSSTSTHLNTTSSYSTLIASNSTTSQQRTVTVTAVSTFHVSYKNGTFITPHTRTQLETISQDESTSRTNTYIFGQGVTDTFTPTIATPHSSTTSQPSSSSSPTSSSPPPIAPLTPKQTQMVGGIVGGVAGIALVLIALLYLLRYSRARLKLNSSTEFNDKLVSQAAPISSHKFIAPSVKNHKFRNSDNTTFTSTSLDSEKGFARLSGRKIPSVLSNGGDQYGGSYGVFGKEIELLPTPPGFQQKRQQKDLSQSSFYQDKEGVYIGDGTERFLGGTGPQTPGRGQQNFDQSRQLGQDTSPNTTNHNYTQVQDGSPRFDASQQQTLSPKRNPFTPQPQKHSSPNPRHRPEYIDTRWNLEDFPGSRPDGVAVFRGSPARTPVTQSPNTESIKLPIQAPVTMDEDVPEMPLPSPNVMGARNFSRLSSRASGRFREEIH